MKKGKLKFYILIFSLVFFSSLFLVLFLPDKEPKPEAVIKDIFVFQNPVIAGKPVEWLVLLEKNKISRANRFIQIPEKAKNIKAQIISYEAGQEIMKKTENRVDYQLAPEERKELSESLEKSFFKKLKGFLSVDIRRVFAAVIENVFQKITGRGLKIINPKEGKFVDLLSGNTGKFVENELTAANRGKQYQEEYLKITYQTPAPKITQRETGKGKEIIVFASELFEGLEQKSLKTEKHITNVLTYSNVPEIYKLEQKNKIAIKWKNNNNKEVESRAYDLNGNGMIDYIEWVTPHLSEQVFDVVLVSRAFLLNEKREFIKDIYQYVKKKDNYWVSVQDGQYIRVKFEKRLDKKRDITIYAKPAVSGFPAKIEVYISGGDKLIAEFRNIDRERKYKVLLGNLEEETDVFDLKIKGNIDFDYITDPAPSTITDTYTDTSKISSSVNVTVDTNAGQVVLSAASSWSCGDTLVDSRDASTYSTVLIGNQCWMAENINVGTMTAGANEQGTDCSSAAAIDKYCYSDNEDNCSTYGGLYQWNQAMCGSTSAGAQGICPNGWHIPTDEEYKILEGTVDSVYGVGDPEWDNTGWRGYDAGTKLKSGGSSGFEGLLAGSRYTSGSFNHLGSYGDFWSSLQSGSDAFYRYLHSGYATVYRSAHNKAYGFSVRCLKD